MIVHLSVQCSDHNYYANLQKLCRFSDQNKNRKINVNVESWIDRTKLNHSAKCFTSYRARFV